MSVGLGTSMGKGTGGDRNQDSDGEEKVEGDKRELENVVDGIAKRRKDGDVVGERKMKLKVDSVSDSMFEAGVLDDEKYVSLEERAVTLDTVECPDSKYVVDIFKGQILRKFGLRRLDRENVWAKYEVIVGS